jgi:hypothetical protein
MNRFQDKVSLIGKQELNEGKDSAIRNSLIRVSSSFKGLKNFALPNLLQPAPLSYQKEGLNGGSSLFPLSLQHAQQNTHPEFQSPHIFLLIVLFLPAHHQPDCGGSLSPPGIPL